MTEIERLRTQLKRLTLHTNDSFEAEADKVAKSQASYTPFWPNWPTRRP